MSQWRHGVCIASTPIALAEIPALIALLAGALAEGTSDTIPLPTPPTLRSWKTDTLELTTTSLRARLTRIAKHRPGQTRRVDAPADTAVWRGVASPTARR